MDIDVGRPHGQPQRLPTLRAQYAISMGSKLTVPVVQQISWELTVYDAQVSKLLSNPQIIWLLGDVPEDDPARLDLDEEQHVVCPQRSGGERKEVACPDELPIVTDEVSPVQAPTVGTREESLSLQYARYG